MGGGARTAYQAGALQAIGNLLGSQRTTPAPVFPFQVLAGTSAGALNATFLASKAMDGLSGLDDLARFWKGLRSEAVYHLPQTPLAQLSRWATDLGLVLSARESAALMDSLALVNTLHGAIAPNALTRLCNTGCCRRWPSPPPVTPVGPTGPFAKPAMASPSHGAAPAGERSNNPSPLST